MNLFNMNWLLDEIATHSPFLLSTFAIVSAIFVLLRSRAPGRAASLTLLDSSIFFFAFVYLLSFGLAASHSLSSAALAWGTYIATGLLAVFALIAAALGKHPNSSSARTEPRNGVLRFSSACCLVLFFLLLLGAYLKATLIGDNTADGLWYHIPRLLALLQQGDLSNVGLPHIDNYHPKAATFWFTWVFSFYGDLRALQLGLMPHLLLAVLSVYAAARRLGVSSAAALCVAPSVAFTPVVSAQLGTSLVDVMMCAYVLAASTLLLDRVLLISAFSAQPQSIANQQRETDSAFPWNLCLALGLVLSTKLSGLLYVGVLLACYFFWERRLMKRLAAFALTFALGAYTYIQNSLMHGNPFFPQGLSLLGFHLPGPGTPELMWEHSQVRDLSLVERFWKSWSSIGEIGYASPTGGFGIHGPLLLLCLLGLPFVCRKGPRLKQNLLFLLLGLTLLAVTPFPYVPRYTVFLIGFAAVAYAIIIDTRKNTWSLTSLAAALVFANLIGISQQWKALRFELSRLSASALTRCDDSTFPEGYSEVFDWLKKNPLQARQPLVVSALYPISNACFWTLGQSSSVHFFFVDDKTTRMAEIENSARLNEATSIIIPRSVAKQLTTLPNHIFFENPQAVIVAPDITSPTS